MTRLDALRVAACTIVLALLAGCAAPEPRSARSSTPANVEVPFDQAIANASDGLLDQLRTVPDFAPPLQLRRVVVLDPMVEASTGQPTPATLRLGLRVGERLTSGLAAIELLPISRADMARAPYLLTGTLTRALAGRPKGSLLLNLALTDLESGSVVAQAWALTNDAGVDSTPLPYEADSPVPLVDKVVEGYIRTSASGAGRPADAVYLAHIAAAPPIAEATALYNAGRYPESLARWRAAAAAVGGTQLRVVDGLYLTHLKLGRTAEAEQAFGQVIALSLADPQLGIRFLFNPGSTAFSADPNVSGAYPLMLRQIAREAVAAKACLGIVGHTSPTGPEAANKTLSLQRANRIRQLLAAEASVLAARSKAIGMGSSETLVGRGTDNAADALDRRVELRVVPCG